MESYTNSGRGTTHLSFLQVSKLFLTVKDIRDKVVHLNTDILVIMSQCTIPTLFLSSVLSIVLLASRIRCNFETEKLELERNLC